MQPSASEISFIFISGSAIMLLVFVFIFLFILMYERKKNRHRLELGEMELNSQRKMLDAIITTQEREKEYFAGELHDSLGQLLSAVNINLSNMQRKAQLDNRDDGLEDLLARTRDITRQSIEEVRAISRKLMPAVLSDFGLEQALSDLCNKMKEGGMVVEFIYNCRSERFPQEIERAIFRISQELINNTVKYAHASIVNLCLNETGSLLHYIYKDNGIGMDVTASTGKGLGMIGIESRVKSVNGSLSVHSQKNNGVEFTITVPVA